MRNNQDEWEVEDIDVESKNKSKKVAIAQDDWETTVVENKKRKKSKGDILVQRSEASLNISEFNVTEVGKEKVKLDELVKTSLKTTGQVAQKNLQNVKKLKKLSVPLHKKHQQKIKRALAYEKVCEDITKWDSLVHSNRTADQLVFPLKKPDFQLQSVEATAENFVTKHPVEIAVAELLEKSEHRLEPEKELTAAEEKALQAMSATEAKLRHAELMRHRALISYQEAKARRQNKIKSKRYHRLLKKEKLKKVMKEFEELQKTDAAKALEQLADLDKIRILERVTLKHRNTGKWAKQQKLRAKYNPDSRSILKEDLSLGRQLREKVEIAENVQANLDSSAKRNPSMDDIGLIEETFGNNTDDDEEPPATHNSINITLETNDSSNKTPEEPVIPEKVNKSSTNKCTLPSKVPTDVDMKDFLSKEQFLDSAAPDGFTLGDEDLDDVLGDVMPMSEAFGDEDCIAEFREEKESTEKANEVKGIDLFLPGWGSWGGPNIEQSKRKKRRFFIKAPSAPARKNTLGNVIINEDKDKKASEHQVNSLPFPFTNVHQFESYIRQPVGHTWNPQSSFQSLVAPKVITKMGKIIEPIDCEDVVLKNKAVTHNKRKEKKVGNDAVKAF
ncbi:U3 small nucleolar RNA-associated protein 14 homolog A [Parasteatoda tepidariorum]|uniref:U3 small nucleolar RNA-associated protein 14 homolog A n=1 Tax=Parasteatoda tepidariorum TaxID=114398 RepID=UPI00077FD27D|nr:U3 small nucleolar RNA-associated protein 14 homolog B [Parasteatoda tepidariorum]